VKALHRRRVAAADAGIGVSEVVEEAPGVWSLRISGRGISRYEAMHMIVEGFFHSVYDRIAVEAVRETLSLAVERKLGIGQ